MEVEASTSHKRFEERIVAWREAYKTKKGIRYRIRWRQDGRKRNRGAGPLPSTANKLIHHIEDNLAQNTPVLDPSTSSYCLKKYLDVMGKTVQRRTVEIARASLAPFERDFGYRFIQEIKTSEIEQFKNRLLEFRNSNGINIVIRNIKTFFQFCLRNGYVDMSPAQSVKQFKVKPVARFLTRKDLTALYLACSKELRRVIFILYRTGMREGEFLGVRKSDIHDGRVMVKGKTGTRAVPLTRGTQRMLKKIAGKWGRSWFEKSFRMAVKRAGIGRIRTHDLRHTFASAYLKSGGTVADLRVVGGWKSLGTLQIYAHFQQDYLNKRMVKVRL